MAYRTSKNLSAAKTNMTFAMRRHPSNIFAALRGSLCGTSKAIVFCTSILEAKPLTFRKAFRDSGGGTGCAASAEATLLWVHSSRLFTALSPSIPSSLLSSSVFSPLLLQRQLFLSIFFICFPFTPVSSFRSTHSVSHFFHLFHSLLFNQQKGKKHKWTKHSIDWRN